MSRAPSVNLSSVRCEACDRLRAKIAGRERALVAATALMTMGAPHVESAEQIRLRARTQDAKIDFELAEMELEQHARQHETSSAGSAG